MNTMSMMVEQINKLPQPERKNKLTSLVSGFIKFAGHSGIVMEELTYNNAVVTLQNDAKVQNHIGTIHAVAQILLAETSTGILVAMNIPDDKIILAKQMNTSFVKRATGAMKATASITAEQIALIHSQEKGEMKIDVCVTDELGVEPIKCEATWVWLPKNRIK